MMFLSGYCSYLLYYFSAGFSIPCLRFRVKYANIYLNYATGGIAVDKKSIVEIALGGVQLFAFFAPAFYLLYAVSCVLNGEALYIVYFLAAVMGALSCLAAISRSKKQLLFKWAVSAILTVIFIAIIRNVNFLTRAFAYFNPNYFYDYGVSRGDGLAVIICFGALALATFVGLIVAASINPAEMNEKAQRVIKGLQRVVCSVVAVAAACVFVYLLIAMPKV